MLGKVYFDGNFVWSDHAYLYHLILFKLIFSVTGQSHDKLYHVSISCAPDIFTSSHKADYTGAAEAF